MEKNDPGNPAESTALAALYGQARKAYQQGRHADAIGLCKQGLGRFGPRHELLNLQALALLALQQPERATKALDQALKLVPDDSGLLLNAARASLAAAQFRQARRHISNALKRGRQNPAVLYQAALYSRESGDFEQARRLAQRACELAPDFSEAWQLAGSMFIDAGSLPQARLALEQAVRARPGNARALSELSRLLGDDPAQQPVRQQLQALHNDASAADADRGTAAFRLADLLRAEQRHTEAFAMYRQANQWCGAGRPFDMAAWQSQVRADRRSEVAGAEHGSGLLFIIGMPRSGTTLCEQMLAAHPAVTAAGELPGINRLAMRLQRQGLATGDVSRQQNAQRKALEAARASYRERLPEHSNSRLVTDKAPLNFAHIGLIEQLFPGSLFVYCRRDPLDTIASVYFQNFQAGLNWAFDLERITGVFIEQAKHMQHWQPRLGARLMTLDYAHTVTDPHAVATALADFASLDFRPEMAEPHRQAAVVTTASNLQVRQPIHRRSLGYARHYLDELSSVRQQLEQAGIELSG